MVEKHLKTSNGVKKKFLFAVILLDILAIGIIPLNLFLIHMSEYISIIISIFILLFNFVFWFKGTIKKAAKIILSLIGVIAILFSLFGTYCNPYWNSLNFRRNVNTMLKDDNMVLTKADALADFDYAMKYLWKLHPALYRNTPEEIENQYTISRKNIENSEKIDICTLNQEIESVFSQLHDAHTHADAWYNNYHYLKYIYEHNQAGDHLRKINGVSLEDLLESKSHLISFESQDYGMTEIYNHISSLEGLKYLGISIEDGIEYTYEDESGSEESYVFTKEDFVTYDEYVAFNNIDATSEEDDPFVYYEIDTKNDIAILTLDSCINNEEYKDCLNKMFSEIKENGIHNVAVDLRNNHGGNSSVANEFLKYINIDKYKTWGCVWRLGIFQIKSDTATLENNQYANLTFDGNLYILTSVSTFSAAMDFAMLVKDNHLGIIIGETSGNAPNSYGDIAYFTLPNSEIYMQISTKKWYRIDESLEHEFIEPDIPCDDEDAIEFLYNEIK